MAVFRIEKTRDYTVLSNHHLKNRSLTLKAKGLMSVLLSLPEDWDYSLRGLSAISLEGVDAIREAIRELEKAGYIIRNRIRNEMGQMKGTEYVIYEHPRSPESASPALEKPAQEKPVQGKPILENPTLAFPTLENPTQYNTYPPNTQRSNTNRGNTQEAIPYPSNPYPMLPPDECRWQVCENISYYQLAKSKRYDRGRLEEIVDLITETLCSTRPTISIGGEEYPADLVKEKLLRLNSMHIDYVFECLENNTSHVRNIKKYMLAVLFNAPSTINSYYSAKANHDLYS